MDNPGGSTAKFWKLPTAVKNTDLQKFPSSVAWETLGRTLPIMPSLPVKGLKLLQSTDAQNTKQQHRTIEITVSGNCGP